MNMVTDNSPPGSDSYDLRSIPGRYPGLGHSLRFCPARYSSFPIGVHENVANSASDILQVREVAMMSVMDRLTDKVDWHKKIFDDQIVSKWRSEALEIPDEEFWNTAWGGKYYRRSGLDPPYLKPLTGIMNANAFDCVKNCFHKVKLPLTFYHSVSRNFASKHITSKRLVLFPLWMRVHLCPSRTLLYLMTFTPC